MIDLFEPIIKQDIERVQKNIKDLFLLDFNPDFFAYSWINPWFPLVQKWDMEKRWVSHEDIKEIWFSYEWKIAKIPYQKRFDYQKFLKSWDLKDLPTSDSKLIS